MRVNVKRVGACADAGDFEALFGHVVVLGEEVDAWFGDLDI